MPSADDDRSVDNCCSVADRVLFLARHRILHVGHDHPTTEPGSEPRSTLLRLDVRGDRRRRPLCRSLRRRAFWEHLGGESAIRLYIHFMFHVPCMGRAFTAP